MKEKKLKPVIFEKGRYNFHSQNLFKQNLLLKALQVTSDPQELKKMAKMKSIAEVYRTLDKLSIRREYHDALARKGLDLDYIVEGIKGICDDKLSGNRTRLTGYQILLRSLGLDEYKETADDSGKNWEEVVRELAQKELGKIVIDGEIEEYDVNPPAIPDEERERIETEKDEGVNLYDE